MSLVPTLQHVKMSPFAPLPGESPEVEPDRNDDPANPYGGYRLDGLYAFGPKGMKCALAVLIAFSLLRVSGSSPHGSRRCKVVNQGREAIRRAHRWRDNGSDPDDDEADFYREVLAIQAGKDQRIRLRSGYGLYGRATKPANSGRKRRVAA